MVTRPKGLKEETWKDGSSFPYGLPSGGSTVGRNLVADAADDFGLDLVLVPPRGLDDGVVLCKPGSQALVSAQVPLPALTPGRSGQEVAAASSRGRASVGTILARSLAAAKAETSMSRESVFLDLFAGTGPVGAFLRRKGYGVIAFDVKKGRQFDLSSGIVLNAILGWMQAGLVWGLWCATPCATATQARRGRLVAGAMPAALRSAEYVRGLPCLRGSELAQATAASRLIDHAGNILRRAVLLGIPAGEENPIGSYLWSFASRQKLSEHWPIFFVDFCAGGSPFRKRTQLLFIHGGNPNPVLLQCKGKHGLCSYTGKPHLHITGVKGSTWVSKLAEPYPTRIAAFIADVLRQPIMLGTVARLSRLTSSRLA